MLKLKEALRQLSEYGARLGREVERLAQGLYALSNIEDEEGLTGALCGLLAASGASLDPGLLDSHRLDVTILHKVREEPSVGADLMIVFASTIPGWELSTRTLVQAKRVEPDKRMTASEWQRMHKQIRRMLFHMHESFVLGYSVAQGLHAVPAVSVAACRSQRLFDLRGYSFSGFIEGIFEGRIGQEPIGAPPSGRSWARHEISILVQEKREAGVQAQIAAPVAPDERGMGAAG